MKFLQLIVEGENVALVKTRSMHSIPKSVDETDVVQTSLVNFRGLDSDELSHNEGFDIDNIDDFIEWHNLRNVVNIVRFTIENVHA